MRIVQSRFRDSENFDPEWLLLREPVDARARDKALMRKAAEWIKTHARSDVARIIDLGAGTGSAARALSPVIERDQDWVLIERDPNLAEVGEKMLRGSTAWTDAKGGPNFSRHVSYRKADLTGDGTGAKQGAALSSYLADIIGGSDLVSASALLDLCSSDWISALAQACAQQQTAAWLTLLVDGRKRRRVSDRLDPFLDRAFQDDMRRDKGFGPALGKAAGGETIRQFKKAGFTVFYAPSDWQLGGDHARLQRLYAMGYAEAARRQRPDLTPQINRWIKDQDRHTRRGLAAMVLGHVDILALPENGA